MSNQPPSASTNGKQCPSSPSLPPTDTRTTLHVSKAPRAWIWDWPIVFLSVFCFVIFAMFVMPGFRRSPKATHCNKCISNLKMLEGACEQAVMAGKTNPVMADLCGPSAYISVTPVCPASKASYTMPALGGTFVCPNPGISGDPVWTHSLYR
jgi:hypothetical protein